MNHSEHYLQQIKTLHKALGISANYIDECTQPLCIEPLQLTATELDYYQRPQKLTPAAFAAWSAMKQSAVSQGVELFLISAYRSIQYQADLIAAKLAKGQALEQILAVNAAPGFSEHHTGRALDIGTSGCDALVEEFEKTNAFQWLEKNANVYGFYMSFPRDNPFGIIYEPWHWCFREPKQA